VACFLLFDEGVHGAVAQETHDAASVLVVDDERGPRESLQLILRAQFHVLTASDGEHALEIIRNQPVDVVTLDLKMPGLSGRETLTRIREIAPDLEVVVVTGYGSFDSAVEALRLRAFDYISKPFESRRILEVVRRAAEARRQRHAEEAAERVMPPLAEIVDEAERWQRDADGRLADLDRAALDRILDRLRALKNLIRDRVRSLPGCSRRRRGGDG